MITECAGITLEDEGFHRIASDIFLAFDNDGNGVVDIGELFSGLSFLCAGSLGDKLKASILIFDLSGDGHL